MLELHKIKSIKVEGGLQERLMAPPNQTWGEMLGQASSNADVLQQPEVVRNIQNILATNVSVCTSLGHPFISQLSRIYMDMLGLYGYGPLSYLRAAYLCAHRSVC